MAASLASGEGGGGPGESTGPSCSARKALSLRMDSRLGRERESAVEVTVTGPSRLCRLTRGMDDWLWLAGERSRERSRLLGVLLHAHEGITMKKQCAGYS